VLIFLLKKNINAYKIRRTNTLGEEVSVGPTSFSTNPIVNLIEMGIESLRPSSDFYHVNVAHLRRDIAEMTRGGDRTRLTNLLDDVVKAHLVKEPA
jgi:hypothetical protein